MIRLSIVIAGRECDRIAPADANRGFATEPCALRVESRTPYRMGSPVYIRWSGWVVIPLWVITMSWLFIHDVYSALTAGEAPPAATFSGARPEDIRAQFQILDSVGNEMGTIWSVALPGETAARREDFIWLDPGDVAFGPVRIRVESTFTDAGSLDEFTVNADSPGATVSIHGERFYAAFSFALEGWIGRRRINETFKIPLSDGESLSATFHPFMPLTGLEVGRAWRMQVLNPLNAITGMGAKFEPVLVTVTSRESLSTPIGLVWCHVVQAPRVKAWIDDSGVVWAQEVELPALGRFRLVRQPSFDDLGLSAKRQFALFDRRDSRR